MSGAVGTSASDQNLGSPVDTTFQLYMMDNSLVALLLLGRWSALYTEVDGEYLQ